MKMCLNTSSERIIIHSSYPSDALDVSVKEGGFEIDCIAGLTVGAASLHKPVMLDGFISTAGGLIAHGLYPEAAS